MYQPRMAIIREHLAARVSAAHDLRPALIVANKCRLLLMLAYGTDDKPSVGHVSAQAPWDCFGITEPSWLGCDALDTKAVPTQRLALNGMNPLNHRIHNASTI